MPRSCHLLGSFALLVMLTALPLAMARECLRSDFMGVYTACINDRRNLIYYKNPDSVCTGTGNQPANVLGLICDVPCPSGEYLPLGSNSTAACTPCNAGSYSLGGGVRIEGAGWVNNTRGWGAVSNSQISFRTSCINTRTGQPETTALCSRWKISGGALAWSGDTSDNDQSILEATASFVRDGTISFEYRVDAERGFDYFNFEIDDVVMVSRVSQQLTFVKVTFNVAPGVHVFRWKYTKDFSLRYGDDAVILRMIEVTGTSFADSQCTQCSPGSYAEQERSSSCLPCPFNTQAPNLGTQRCEACSDTEYAYVGSARCLPSDPCVQSDVVSYYSPCHSNGTRSRYYYYQTPKICSEKLSGAYVKPNDRYDLPCAQCSPGWYRNANTHLCEGCPTNTYSPGNDQPCRPCQDGHVGRRDFIWTNFEELPNPSVPAAMGCNGDCGTNGWRLGSGFIDSGVGHGAYSDVYFTLNLTVVSDSVAHYNISFACNRLCYLSYTDHDITGTNATNPVLRHTQTSYSLYFTQGPIYPQHVPITSGDHMLTFHFSKFDGTSVTTNDHVKIHAISVESVAAGQGGAATCQGCVAGQYADANTPYCKVTPPGTFSLALAKSPTLCPENTYAELPGSDHCDRCGRGTTAPRGSSWCDESCKYRYNSDINYDLKPLSRVGGDMYGPIVDPISRRNYFLNVCTRDHTNTTCFNDDNLPVSTQACLTDAWGFGLDLGRVTNFYPHPRDPANGVTIVYANSTVDNLYPCRVNTPQGRITVPRSTNITFNCDPMAGYGAPEFRQEGSNNCVFHFEWNSLFACSACDDSDWNYYYTDCVNGKQYKTYKWKDNPRNCHGGLPLPDPEERQCSVDTQTPCPAGTYLLEECTPCEAGSYSLGGGRILNSWPYGLSPDPEVFDASHPQYISQQSSYLQFLLPINQNTILSSTFTTTFNWVVNGYIEFAISAVTGNGYTLRLITDTNPQVPMVIPSSTSPRIVRFSTTPGTHTFQFLMNRGEGTLATAQGWLRIFNVTTMGTSRAASQCTQALPGTYVYDATRLPMQCPPNTIQPLSGQTQCNPVTDLEKWSPAGSDAAYQILACSWHDYDAVPISACGSDGHQEVELRLRPGVRCVNPLTPPQRRIPCTCAPGMYREGNGPCRSCANGLGYDATARACVRATKGNAAINVFSFVQGREIAAFNPGSKRDQTIEKSILGADARWSTSCSGPCLRPWTFGVTDTDGPVLDSGLQVGASSSSISIEVPVSAGGGTLAVSYRRQGAGNTQFHILVDNVVIHTNTDARVNLQIFNYQLAAGTREITFVVFANEEIIANAVTRIIDFKVTGAAIGSAVVQRCPTGTFSADGATVCNPCAPGTYSRLPGSSECQVCEEGKHAPFYGSSDCAFCPAGSTADGTSAAGHILCLPMCVVNHGDDYYNWRDLPTTIATVRAENRLTFPDLSVNLCEPITDGCHDRSGQANGAFGCAANLLTDGPELNFGTRPSGNARFNPQTKQIELSYVGGDKCASGAQRTFNVLLQCPGHASASQSSPQLILYSDCHAELVWYTSSACRACREGDYKAVAGECLKRKQTINYVLNSDDCHHSDWTQPPPTERACSSVGVSIGFLIGIGIALVLLAVSLIIFFMRNRKLTTEYRLLKEAHDGGFVDNETQFGVDEDDDEGVTLDQIDDDDGLRLPTAQSSDDPHEEL